MIDKNELLKKQTYHWFWGVRTYSECRPNDILSKINVLTDEQIAAMRENQLRITSKFVLIRFFYWLFNWDNYVESAYLLKAYDWLLDETAGDIMNRGFLDTILDYCEYGLGAMLPNFVNVFTGWMDNAEIINNGDTRVPTDDDLQEPSNQPRAEISASDRSGINSSHHSEDNVKTIHITFDMLSHLNVLGLQHSIGMSLTLRELKKAYYQKALASHPDKNLESPEAAETFRVILESFNFLTEKFDINVNPDSRFFSHKPNTFDELSRELDRMNQEADDISSDYRRISQNCDAMIEMVENLLAIARQQGEEIEARNRQEATRDMETHEDIETGHQVVNAQTMALIPTDVSPYSELNYVVRRNQPQSHSIYFFNLPHQQKKKESSQQESTLMIYDKPANK